MRARTRLGSCLCNSPVPANKPALMLLVPKRGDGPHGWWPSLGCRKQAAIRPASCADEDCGGRGTSTLTGWACDLASASAHGDASCRTGAASSRSWAVSVLIGGWSKVTRQLPGPTAIGGEARQDPAQAGEPCCCWKRGRRWCSLERLQVDGSEAPNGAGGASRTAALRAQADGTTMCLTSAM